MGGTIVHEPLYSLLDLIQVALTIFGGFYLYDRGYKTGSHHTFMALTNGGAVVEEFQQDKEDEEKN